LDNGRHQFCEGMPEMQTRNIWIKKQFLLFCFLIGFASALYAVEVQLYQVELPTQNETGNFDQAALLKQAFETVLTRATGSSQFLVDPVITHALPEVDQYVKQFSYHQRSAIEKTIKVIFNENRINALLKSAKQSIWKKDRPLVLVWLSGTDREPLLIPEIEKVFNKRGIPFVFPLLDLTDTTTVSDQDLLGEKVEALETAAKRYSPDVILSGDIVQKNGIFEARWRFINARDQSTWDNSGATLELVLNQAADTLTLKIKGQKVSVAAAATSESEPTAIHHVTLTIVGNLDVQQYNKILEHLRRLPGVSEVEVAQIMPDKTLFDLVTTQSKEMLSQSISDGQMLIKTSTTEGASEAALTYEVSGVL
jgi:hypothetical protein